MMSLGEDFLKKAVYRATTLKNLESQDLFGLVCKQLKGLVLNFDLATYSKIERYLESNNWLIMFVDKFRGGETCLWADT